MQKQPKKSQPQIQTQTRKTNDHAPSRINLENLAEVIKTKFGLGFDPKPFQVEAAKAQLLQKDALVHAHTGAGKSLIIAAPHAHPQAEEKVTFVVSPLIALQDEHAAMFREDYGLSTIAINSAHGGLTPENLSGICAGKYQIVIISPEMMLTRRFIERVLQNSELRRRVLSVVVDEAHVISHWGAGFRKKYGELGILRALLPKDVPFAALSATLSPRVRSDVISKLHYSSAKRNGFINIDIGNDRPNVSLVVRAMEHAMNTYRDLDFVIPPNITPNSPIPKTFIYADNVATGADIQDHLESLLPEHLCGTGLIRPYSAAYSKKYRQDLMEEFKRGDGVRILICTDAAGMGCNISDIDVVVQWKLPETMSVFVQRAGRAARGRGRTGLGVLLVEKSAYTLNCEKLEEIGAGGGGKNKKDLHPRAGWEPVLDYRAKDENLLAFVLTGKCRREILTKVYKNEPLSASQPTCCDICDPSLLDRCRPGAHVSQPRQTGTEKGELHKPTQLAIHEWRMNIYKRDHSRSQWSFKGILTDAHLELLSSIGPISSLGHLKNLLGQWIWWERYGNELWEKCVSTLQIPPFKKKVKENSKSIAGEKRKESERGEEELNTCETPSQKRAKTSSTSNQNIPPPRMPTAMNTRPSQEQTTGSVPRHRVSHLNSSLHSQPYPATPVFPTSALAGPSSTPQRDPFRVLSAYPTPNSSLHYTARPGPDVPQPYHIPAPSSRPYEPFSSPAHMPYPTNSNSSRLAQNVSHPDSNQQQIYRPPSPIRYSFSVPLNNLMTPQPARQQHPIPALPYLTPPSLPRPPLANSCATPYTPTPCIPTRPYFVQSHHSLPRLDASTQGEHIDGHFTQFAAHPGYGHHAIHSRHHDLLRSAHTHPDTSRSHHRAQNFPYQPFAPHSQSS